MGGRAAMQRWEMFPLYVGAAVWTSFVAETQNTFGALDIMSRELHRLGMRHPSEPTQAMLVACLVLREADEEKKRKMQAANSLRTLYGNVKTQLKGFLVRRMATQPAVPGGEYVATLPPNVDEAPAALAEVAFGGARVPACPWPIQDLMSVANMVPQRSTHINCRPGVEDASRGAFGVDTMQAMMQGMAMASWYLQGHTGAHGQHGVSFARSNSLQDLLDGSRQAAPLALTNATTVEATKPSAPLALVAPPVDPSTETEAVAKTVTVSAPSTAPSCKPDAGQGGGQSAFVETETESQVSEKSAGGKAPCTVDGQENPRKKMNLADSLKALSDARAQKESTGGEPEAVGEPEDSKLDASVAKPKPRPKAKGKAKALPKGKPKKAAPKAKSKGAKGSAKGSASASVGVSRAENKRKRLQKIPASVRASFTDGCARCRYASGCTPSCWKLRGWDV